MNSFEKLKEKFEEGIEQTWDNLSEGWRQLQRRAGRALTLFTPPRKHKTSSGELITADENVFKHASRWSVLAAEVKDYDDKVSVQIEVPGMEIDDFDIEVVGTTLYVSGEKRAKREKTLGSYHVMETAYGHFERVVSLPAEVDELKAKAKYKRGVLKIMLPKVTPSKRKRIKIVST